jgi:hypothetical protein
MIQAKLRFDGADYQHERDCERLSGQLLRVWECIKDGQWRTLSRISTITGDPEASISAQLRHLRKPRFGRFHVEKRYINNGLYEYRVNLTH